MLEVIDSGMRGTYRRAPHDGATREIPASLTCHPVPVTRSGSAWCHLDRTLAQAEDGALVMASDGTILLWNRMAERILGYSVRDALGHAWEKLLGIEHVGNRGGPATSRVHVEGAVQSFDLQVRARAGRLVWLNITALAVADQNGDILIVHLFRDVTAARNLLVLLNERLLPGRVTADGRLSRREMEVLGVLATGADTKSIATRLHVSPATVRNHVQSIMRKLGVHSRLEAVVHVAAHGALGQKRTATGVR